MTNATPSTGHAFADIDPMRFADRAEHAAAGWWAAVALIIVVVGAVWLLRYLVTRNDAILVDLKTTNAQTITILTGVVERNTTSNNDVRAELSAMRQDVVRIETAVRDAKMSVRKEASMGDITKGYTFTAGEVTVDLGVVRSRARRIEDGFG